MATKKGPGKKGSAKKSAAKKSSKKSTKRASIVAPTPTFPNLRCIEACAVQYGKCLSKGVDPQLCLKRLRRCVQNCLRGGVFVPDE